jgi:regulator of sirC expression with transglutaminase-like and TPR domain
MSSRTDALVRLFRDDDPSTVGLVKEQLLLQGESVVPELRDLLNADSAIVAAHAQEVLHQIEGKKASARLEEMIRSGKDLPWEEVSMLVASALLPWVDPADTGAQLDAWGEELRLRLALDPEHPVPVITGFLHGSLGFDGNAADYYNHENSLLPTVIENRKGLPLTLTLLYRFVAVRAGLEIQGVNLPGHFIARCGEVFFDPFHGGRILSLADCADILARQGLELTDEHLETPGSREVVARMLANLGHAYSVEESRWQKAMVDRWLGLLTGAEQ